MLQDAVTGMEKGAEMTNAELIAALKRLIAGQQLTPQESVEVIALVIQNTKRPN